MINKSALKIKIVSLLRSVLGKERVGKMLINKYLSAYRSSSIIFIHIPKAAGTSITDVLYGQRNGHLTASVVKKGMGPDFDRKYSFSVSRNPYSRLVSAYKFATQGETHDGAIANPSFYQQPVFSSFERFVKEWLIHQDLLALDNVFKPQHHFVFDNSKLLVNDLFKLEEMDKLEDVLTKRLGKEVKINKKNTTKSSEKQERYTEELKDIVFKLYKKDFELFSYSR